jgi:transcriptional regulator with XRE-family HTH domain
MSQIERGVKNVTLPILWKLARALEVNPSELIQNVESKTSHTGHDVSGEFILDPFERSELLTPGIPLIGLQCKIVTDASIPTCKGMHFPCKKDGQWKCCYQGGH